MEYKYLILDSKGNAVARGVSDHPPVGSPWRLKIDDGDIERVMRHTYVNLVGNSDQAPAMEGKIVRQQGNWVYLEPVRQLDESVRQNLRMPVRFTSWVFVMSLRRITRPAAAARTTAAMMYFTICFRICSIYLPVDGVILVVFNLLMLAALFSGLLLILTSTSSTLKEAQSKSTIVMFLPMIIAFATMYVDVADVSMWTMCLPIYNVIISIKLLLAGVMNYAYLWGALAINIVYAVLSVFVTMKTFSKESLITK